MYLCSGAGVGAETHLYSSPCRNQPTKVCKGWGEVWASGDEPPWVRPQGQLILVYL